MGVEQKKAMPEKYMSEVLNTGSIEKLSYKTNSYDETNRSITKELNVYLPQCYDPTNDGVKYNILYLMHGGGENENTLFGGPGENSELKNILDHMIENKEIQPLIVVTPTFCVEGREDFVFGAKNFYKELVQDVLPFIEGRYHTYTKDVTKQGLVAAREHRAFGGFSMGSCCTWGVYIHCLEYFRDFMPLSGDCWELAQKGGLDKSKETADFLAEVARRSGYQQKDYNLFCSTGSEDIAYENMLPQMEEMKKLTDVFTFTEDGHNGNFTFWVTEGRTHWWHYVNEYIHHTLPFLFQV